MIKDEDDFILIIPARYNSSRLPGKLLLDLDGEKVLEKVINRCLKVVKNSQIIVATDDKRIANFCNKININNLMTSKNCKTGTDRVSEVASNVLNFPTSDLGITLFIILVDDSPKNWYICLI